MSTEPVEDAYPEVGDPPSRPPCRRSELTLLFNCSALAWKTQLVDGQFDLTHARQKLSRIGPIPEGRYWIQPSLLMTRLPILHLNYGRSGLFIDGGSVPGSAECIDHAPLVMDRFVADLKNLLGGLPECYIELEVSYLK